MTTTATPPTGYKAGRLEEPQVRAMFDRVAKYYDLLNSVMTAGLHHKWRSRAVDLARVGTGARVLDVACGTGDLAIELAGRVGPTGSVIGSDFSPGMLDLARVKDPSLTWELGNALDLQHPDDTFDAVTVGFGARNFSDLDQGLREMTRVAKPGGRVVVLEMTNPTKPPLSTFFRLWFDRAVPVLGKISGDPEAYEYLPSSVKRFPDAHTLAGQMHAAGLDPVKYVLTAGGIIAIHVGEKRA